MSCEDCEFKKVQTWIGLYGSERLKFIANKETCKSADTYDLYIVEKNKKESQFKNNEMLEFNMLKQLIEKRNMSYTQKQLDRLFDLRDEATKISDIGKIETFIESLEEVDLVEDKDIEIKCNE